MGTFNFAYVRYRDDQETAIVNVKDIRKFDQATHNPSRCYWVLWEQKKPSKNPDDGSSDDESMEIDTRPQYYRAQIILLGETEEDVKERIKNGPRLKIPKVIDSSVESMTELDDSENDSRSPSRHKRKLEDEQQLNKEKNAKTKKAKDATLLQIMDTKLKERSSSFPLSPSPQPTSSLHVSTGTPKSILTPVNRINPLKKRIPNATPARNILTKPASTTGTTPPTKNTPLIKSPSATASCTTCKQQSLRIKKLSEAKESLEAEVASLKELNRRLQNEVLDKFHEVTGIATTSQGRNPQTPPTVQEPPAENIQDTAPEVKYEDQDGQVSLGAGILIPKEKFDRITSETRNSLVVKNLAVAIWGTETLRRSSVTGKSSNRFKDRQPLPALEPAMVSALKDFFEYHLGKQPLQPEERRKELKEFARYIREKIQDLKPRKLTDDQ